MAKIQRDGRFDDELRSALGRRGLRAEWLLQAVAEADVTYREWLICKMAEGMPATFMLDHIAAAAIVRLAVTMNRFTDADLAETPAYGVWQKENGEFIEALKRLATR